jgi:ferrochelatase
MIDSVLFVGFGGPEKPADVMPFLRNVVFGRGVPDSRLAVVEHHYLELGGRSPYNELTERQRAGVERALRAHGVALPVYCGMRNWDPYLEDVIARMNADGRKRALGVILAAHRSEASWERYMGDVACAIAGNSGTGPAMEWLDPWYDDPRFLEANAQRIEAAAGRARGAWPDDLPILLTAHSIPTAMAEQSPYVKDLTASCAGARLLGARDWELCWQSRSGDRAPWLEPDVNDALRRRAAEGVREVVVQAIGFIIDHVEVLYDLTSRRRRRRGARPRAPPRAVRQRPSEFVAMLGERIEARLASGA